MAHALFIQDFRSTSDADLKTVQLLGDFTSPSGISVQISCCLKNDVDGTVNRILNLAVPVSTGTMTSLRNLIVAQLISDLDAAIENEFGITFVP